MPISAATEAATRPVTISAAMTGPSSRYEDVDALERHVAFFGDDRFGVVGEIDVGFRAPA